MKKIQYLKNILLNKTCDNCGSWCAGIKENTCQNWITDKSMKINKQNTIIDKEDGIINVTLKK